ncbi:hypothetical protein F4809DRAFT_615352 [Biscogniauxia mediterranea]|nr:hypothetical protein F4809DRAFT_615352 [Biscogniauxia mediterranea]
MTLLNILCIIVLTTRVLMQCEFHTRACPPLWIPTYILNQSSQLPSSFTPPLLHPSSISPNALGREATTRKLLSVKSG